MCTLAPLFLIRARLERQHVLDLLLDHRSSIAILHTQLDHAAGLDVQLEHALAGIRHQLTHHRAGHTAIRAGLQRCGLARGSREMRHARLVRQGVLELGIPSPISTQLLLRELRQFFLTLVCQHDARTDDRLPRAFAIDVHLGHGRGLQAHLTKVGERPRLEVHAAHFMIEVPRRCDPQLEGFAGGVVTQLGPLDHAALEVLLGLALVVAHVALAPLTAPHQQVLEGQAGGRINDSEGQRRHRANLHERVLRA